MHTSNALAERLVPELSALKEELDTKVANQGLYKSLDCLVDYTKSEIMAHDFSAVKQCFNVAEAVYQHGNLLEKNAVETVFVYSFSAFINSCDDQIEKQVESLMPPCLRMAYMRQMIDSGI